MAVHSGSQTDPVEAPRVRNIYQKIKMLRTLGAFTGFV